MKRDVWTWWCMVSFDKPKRTVCLHIALADGREVEARYDVDERYYRDNIVRVTRAPQTVHDFREVRMGIWNEIADKTETWPRLRHIIDDLTAYVARKNGLSRADATPEDKP